MIDITTTTRVQNIIKSSSLPTVDGNLIADMIDGLTPVAERWLGRKLQKTAYTQQMDVRRGQSVFQLDAYPVETSPALALREASGWTGGLREFRLRFGGRLRRPRAV